MNIILTAVVSVTLSGAVCALILSVAAKVMAVRADERAQKLQESLPGSNCGACGYPGCAGYAAALAGGGDVSVTLCAPGGAETAQKISAILGVAAGDVVKRLAVVHCRGDAHAAQKKMDYSGIPTCAAAKQLYGGDGACAYGCQGYGDCGAVCPSDAICVEDGLARVIADRCTGCGLCVKACPYKLITVENAGETAAVKCSSLDKGAAARKKCAFACIACRKCAKDCPSAAIAIADNLARIDYAKCTRCDTCVESCPTHSIQRTHFKTA